MNDQPCVRNLRLTVPSVIELLAVYLDRNELRREYPELEDEDIRQSLAFAASYLEDRNLAFRYEAIARSRIAPFGCQLVEPAWR
jgi:uncharacterized protein (DUF433 family)